MTRRFTLLTSLLIAGSLSAMGPGSSASREALANRVAPIQAQLDAERIALGLDANHGFRAENVVVDERGDQYIRFRQLYRGLWVWGGESLVRTDAQGNRKDGAIHDLYPVADLPVQPSLSLEAAKNVGFRFMTGVRGFVAGAQADPAVELLVYPIKRQVPKASAAGKPADALNALDVEERVERYALAYYVRVKQKVEGRSPVCRDMMIDAHTGSVLAEWDSLTTAPAQGTGRTLYSGSVSLDTNSSGSKYELKDLTRTTNPNFYVTPEGSSNVYTSSSNVFGDGTTANTQTVAADAMWGLSCAYDMLKNCQNWRGLDNNNKGVKAAVHLNDDNAYYQNATVTFGDGVSVFKPLVSIDVVAHEYGHGVCEYTADLIYSGESGGLNESNSDILGEMSEFYGKSGKTGSTIPSTGGDWVMGQEISRSGTPLRYMYKPSKDGKSPDAWYSGIGNLNVHYSSGPNNRMFYFLAKGSTASGDTSSSYLQYGPIQGIGLQKATAIWVKALTTRMTNGTNYAAALNACKAVAEELYGTGSVEARTVQRAYAAVNVGKDVNIGGSLSIDSQPVSQTVQPNASVTFQVAVSGGTTPYTYQWYKNGSPVGSSAATYTFTARAADDGARIKVDVTDSSSPAKTVSSNEAILHVGSAPSNLIQNGGFEQGTTPWGGNTGVIGDWSGATTPQPAYEGTRCAYLGGYGRRATEALYQTVTVPSGASSANLSFYLHIDTAERGSTAYDKLSVQVRNSSGSLLKTLATYSNVNAASGYARRSFDLSAYRGQTVRVHFAMTEDYSLQTSFVVDGVSLTVQ